MVWIHFATWFKLGSFYVSLKEVSAIRESHFHESLYVFCSNAEGGATFLRSIQMDDWTQGVPSERCSNHHTASAGLPSSPIVAQVCVAHPHPHPQGSALTDKPGPLVHHFPFLGPFLIDTDYCRLGTNVDFCRNKQSWLNGLVTHEHCILVVTDKLCWVKIVFHLLGKFCHRYIFLLVKYKQMYI